MINSQKNPFCPFFSSIVIDKPKSLTNFKKANSHDLVIMFASKHIEAYTHYSCLTERKKPYPTDLTNRQS